RYRMVVPGTEVNIWPKPSPFLSDDERHLGVGLEFDESVYDLHSGAFEVAGPADVAFFFEARLEPDQRRH
mgnify:CR=1